MTAMHTISGHGLGKGDFTTQNTNIHQFSCHFTKIGGLSPKREDFHEMGRNSTKSGFRCAKLPPPPPPNPGLARLGIAIPGIRPGPGQAEGTLRSTALRCTLRCAARCAAQRATCGAAQHCAARCAALRCERSAQRSAQRSGACRAALRRAAQSCAALR